MADYWLSFTVATHNDEQGISGRDRRDALIASVGEISPSMWWDETTSFIVFSSRMGIDFVGSRLKASISQADDLILIRKMNVRTARICGQNFDKDIFRLMSVDGVTYLQDITDPEFRINFTI